MLVERRRTSLGGKGTQRVSGEAEGMATHGFDIWMTNAFFKTAVNLK